MRRSNTLVLLLVLTAIIFKKVCSIEGIPQEDGFFHISLSRNNIMKKQTLVYETWQPKPIKNLVERNPIEEGVKLYEKNTERLCIICSSPKIPRIFDSNKRPLVLECTKFGHKSWTGA